MNRGGTPEGFSFTDHIAGVFPEGYFTEDLVTTAYMTSYHEVDERDGFVQREEEVHLGEAKMVEKKGE